MTVRPPLRPVRGFDWRLAPLQRKLEWEADEAQAAVARELARRESAASATREAESLLVQASQDARQALEAHADPRAHRHQLAYLTFLNDRVAGVRADEQRVAGDLSAARQELLRRQRRLDVVLRARANALELHLREAARRAQVQVDADWLALRELRGGKDAEGCA
ncbi:hypothetical protein [Ramlibacter humi]|uniref:Flagellar FliJ protein n=1 Tax=Ramlibacter humi TaxID=2530451 RepID=A0A4Z0BFC2_9BURK|nr:hypothetical protein [Ramlibacter humi]TFY97079.1 hypothetical protein EZ216_19665 [Ramlibacter humi]